MEKEMTGQVDSGGQSSLTAACEDCHVEEVLEKLDRELIGLKPVKMRIREIAALLLVDRLRKQMNLSSSTPTLHMSFTGNPGTGKTTVAMRMAEILHRLGYVRRPEVVSVTRDDLVGQYIGHTAPKTKAILKKAMGGVLFIDEAYYLYKPENERDYGAESIEILLQIMENNRDDLVVILAGYKDRMDQFFLSNPGMRSRIAHHIDFPDYSQDELSQIASLLLAEQQYQFSPDAAQAFHEYLGRRMQMPQFANARSVRNALDRARLRHANRIYAKGGTPTRQDLMTIQAGDILASRVFSEGQPDHVEVQPKEAQPEVAAEKKTLTPVPQIDTPAPAPAKPRTEPDNQNAMRQDGPMQTTTDSNEPTSPGSTAGSGFGAMPHAAPANGNGKRWEKRNKRARVKGQSRTPQPRPEDLRTPPTVVNGRCEFGSCEEDTQPENIRPAAAPYIPPAAPPKPQAAPPRLATPAPLVQAESPVSGFGVPRELHTPQVVVRRVAKNRSVSRTAAPARIERPAPTVVNGHCEFGQCEAPSKVEETATTGGQIVTGTPVERSVRVTGNESGSCKKITGTEYIGPDQYAAFCETTPAQPAPKVGVSRTVKNKSVTGTQVGTSSKVTGDETGSCKHITGDEYLNPATADVPCTSAPSLAPAKVNVSRTTHGRSVTGTLVGRSEKVTGDEYGGCKPITGTEYLSVESQQQFCGTTPAPAPQKVGVSRTWGEQAVSGTQVGRSTKVTGDEYGACKPVTGTAYIGRDGYDEFCAPAAAKESAARVPVRSTPGHSMTGIQPGGKGKMTGDERGACLGVTGTPYVGVDQYKQGCGGNAPVAESAKGVFSIIPPARQAVESRARQITGSAIGGTAHISGPTELSEGLITGTPEFRNPRDKEMAATAPESVNTEKATSEKMRVTGEGIEARRITGDDWARNERVTGTEGRSTTGRNLTQRGQPRGTQASSQRFREIERPEAPSSKVTGSSGNTVSGSLITISGGARG